MAPPDHYFSTQPSSAPKPREVTMVLPTKGKVKLATASGMFSPEQIDLGTALLLKRAPMPEAGQSVLDLGCGYGPVAVAVGLEQPEAHIVAVDINKRALALTSENAKRHGLENIEVALPDDVTADKTFDVIYSNPPIRIGKAALHQLLTTWLSRLNNGGVAYLVVHKYLGSDSLHSWISENGWKCKRRTSVKGFRILEVRVGDGAGRTEVD